MAEQDNNLKYEEASKDVRQTEKKAGIAVTTLKEEQQAETSVTAQKEEQQAETSVTAQKEEQQADTSVTEQKEEKQADTSVTAQEEEKQAGNEGREQTSENKEKSAAEQAAPVKKKKKKKLPKKVIVLENVGVRFNIQEQKVDNLKEFFIRIVKRTLRYKEFWALRNINLTVRKGDRVGILGLNGAGKSTLLKCIAGVLKPSEGSVSVTGNIVPLLELGAGFDKDYTGAENIYLYGSMLGYSRQFLKEKFNDIVAFSELGDFINVPVKNYSSGMKARLGFSIATIVEPEILILDEVLSVGDARFRKKSARKLQKMMKKGVTVLFVSHSAEQVLENCNKAIILENGKLIASGKAAAISAQYEQMIARPVEQDP